MLLPLFARRKLRTRRAWQLVQAYAERWSPARFRGRAGGSRDKQEVRWEAIAYVTDINCKGTKKAFQRQMKCRESVEGDWVNVWKGRLTGVPSLQWMEAGASRLWWMTTAHFCSSASSRGQTAPIPISTPPLKSVGGPSWQVSLTAQPLGKSRRHNMASLPTPTSRSPSLTFRRLLTPFIEGHRGVEIWSSQTELH